MNCTLTRKKAVPRSGSGTGSLASSRQIQLTRSTAKHPVNHPLPTPTRGRAHNGTGRTVGYPGLSFSLPARLRPPSRSAVNYRR
jgi:hypothetical protein